MMAPSPARRIMGTTDAPTPADQGEQDNPPTATSDAGQPQPIEQGSTAQEQAQGQVSTGEPPPEAPGQQPAQGDEPSFTDEQKAQAQAQSPAEPQVVPEVRPQAFQQAEVHSDSELRAKEADGGPMDQEAYDRANSDQAKEDSVKNSRTP